MQNEAFQNWRTEREAIEAEMTALLQTELIVLPEDRRVRTMRFMALLERRDVAARHLLATVRRSSSCTWSPPTDSIVTREVDSLNASDETELLNANGCEAGALGVEVRESQEGAHATQVAYRRSLPADVGQRLTIPESIGAFMRSLLK